MNKKQLIFMWVGIAAIVLFALLTIVDAYRPDYANFAVWVFLVVIVTSGLVYTFRDKKRQEGKKIGTINTRRGFRRITLVFAVVASIFCAFYVGTIPNRKYHVAQTRSKECKYETYMANIRADPNILATIDGHAKAERSKLLEAGFSDKEIDDYFQEEFRKEAEIKLIELEGGFWVTLSKPGLAGLCILAGLVGAAAGFGGIWLVYFLIWLVYLLISLFISWIVLGFSDTSGKQRTPTNKE